MPDELAARTRQRLQVLRESFKVHLHEMLEQVAMGWSTIHTGADQASVLSDLQELYRTIHRITGSAGSFGFQSISEATAPLEVLLGRVHETGELPSREVHDQIHLFVEHLLDVWHQQQASDAGTNPVTEEAIPDRSELDPGAVYAVGPADSIDDLTRQLAPFGYRLRGFAQASEAMAVCDQETPGVLLWLNPVESLGDWPAMMAPVPVLVLAADPGVHQRLTAVRSGCQGFLEQPVDLTDLVVWLEQLTRRVGQPVEPYRILIVDDDPHLADCYRLVLQMAGIGATVLSEPLRILEVLVASNPDLILMDIHMPDCNGIELVQVIRQHLSYLHIPIVFLSVEDNRERQLHARVLGGDDFLPKPVNAQALVQVVRSRAERSRALRTALRLDGLTGLLNQVGLKERLGVELLRARRQSIPISLGLVDLDHLQSFNEQHGHYQGDQVLRALTRLLTRRLRRTDIVARYGGGEFAIIFIDTPIDVARQVMEEIRHSFAAIELGPEASDGHHLSLSCGIAAWIADEESGALLASARVALRAAKAAGRDRVVSNPPEPGVKP